MLQTLDRRLAPAFKQIEHIELVKATGSKLSNQIPVYSVNAGTQDLIKVEFIFPAGMFHQEQPLQAATVNAMMEEGTSKMTAAEIADAIDFYGAFLEVNVGQDNAYVVLYSLNKHLGHTLPVVEQILKDASFPEEELAIHLQNKLQKFLVNNQKVATIARKRFTELLFGAQHPYGINVVEKDFARVNQQVLIDFYKGRYNSDNCQIVLSGKVTDEVVGLVEKHFGGNDWSSKQSFTEPAVQIQSFTNRLEMVEKADALQSAIRIGKVMFNKTHADFHPLQVLNTAFGGYFGSRLMSNIREDKGYTYGIGSGLVSLKNSGYFFISTEVGVDVCQKAIHEIYFEMKRLRDELIPSDELELVKNYMLGTFLRSVDGPFAMADRFKGILEYGLGYDYFDRYVATIKSISASEIRELANQYLQESSMLELVAGKK